jgi:protocatechuate 3,4-dioxygenase, alpha subunit
MAPRTPSQTIGPFFHVGLKWEGGEKVAFAAPGERIVLTGRVFDGSGAVVSDAMIETWQADTGGKVPGAGPDKAFGCSRVNTDADGRYTVETSMPGACTGPNGEKYAPQIHVTIFSRGLLKALRTRVLLASPERAAADPLVSAAGPRASTVIASRDEKNPSLWHWDIRLQGANETAFIEP